MKATEIADEARRIVNAIENEGQEVAAELIVTVLTLLADHVTATAGEGQAAHPITSVELIELASQAKRYLVLREVFVKLQGATAFTRNRDGALEWVKVIGYDDEAALKHLDAQCDREIERIEGES